MRRRDDVARLRGLAGEVGTRSSGRLRRSHWRLTDERGLPVVDPKTGATAFTIEAATRFLEMVKQHRRLCGSGQIPQQRG
jgi:hypothetical protein